jgi:hypothetical protein
MPCLSDLFARFSRLLSNERRFVTGFFDFGILDSGMERRSTGRNPVNFVNPVKNGLGTIRPQTWNVDYKHYKQALHQGCSKVESDG